MTKSKTAFCLIFLMSMTSLHGTAFNESLDIDILADQAEESLSRLRKQLVRLVSFSMKDRSPRNMQLINDIHTTDQLNARHAVLLRALIGTYIPGNQSIKPAE